MIRPRIVLIRIIFLVLVAVGCNSERRPKDPVQVIPQLYTSGQVVCVRNHTFVVEHISSISGKYRLKLVDCRSKECFYYILKKEIELCN